MVRRAGQLGGTSLITGDLAEVLAAGAASICIDVDLTLRYDVLQDRSHHLDQGFNVSFCYAQLAMLLLHGVLKILVLNFKFLHLSLIVDHGRLEFLSLLLALPSNCL